MPNAAPGVASFKPATASMAVAAAVKELGDDAPLNDLVRVALKRATVS